MKKIAFVLAVLLLATPTWAATISAVQVPDTNQVEIRYDFSDANLPRAFGVDITVTDGNIIACTAEMVGECNADDKGYGIFPGTIIIEADGTVSDDGTPVAPAGAIGTPPDNWGIGTAGITVEMGSLYADTNDAPASVGVLCTIVVTENCTVNIAGNAARCGEGSEALGVVMEDPTEVVIPEYIPGDVVLEIDCFDSAHPDYNEWVAVGKPECWCYKYQCYGDADGMKNGDAFTGYSRVRHADLGILLAGWKVEEPPDGPGIDTITNGICGDFDRTLNGDAFTGYSRVRHADLGILLANWKDDSGIPMADPGCGGDIDLTPP